MEIRIGDANLSHARRNVVIAGALYATACDGLATVLLISVCDAKCANHLPVSVVGNDYVWVGRRFPARKGAEPGKLSNGSGGLAPFCG
ncbi:MAG TPA: hypothetical protein VGR84_16370, partial [Candidatus Acidoferrales bacterium]|nr:hypothetical protein [Candidatus Acidoferrales bacterium]